MGRRLQTRDDRKWSVARTHDAENACEGGVHPAVVGTIAVWVGGGRAKRAMVCGG
jgi:hypothetical protein